MSMQAAQAHASVIEACSVLTRYACFREKHPWRCPRRDPDLTRDVEEKEVVDIYPWRSSSSREVDAPSRHGMACFCLWRAAVPVVTKFGSDRDSKYTTTTLFVSTNRKDMMTDSHRGSMSMLWR